MGAVDSFFFLHFSLEFFYFQPSCWNLLCSCSHICIYREMELLVFCLRQYIPGIFVHCINRFCGAVGFTIYARLKTAF